MLRVVERVLGEGDVHRGGACVGAPTTSCRSIASGWTRTASSSRATSRWRGTSSRQPDVLEPLLGTSAPLTLHLDAQRAVDVYLLNPDGAVTSADDRGFYPTAGVRS